MDIVKTYYDNGQLKIKAWCVDGGFHRLAGPAIQFWYANGQLKYEEWYVNDTRHHLNGPAVQEWHWNGQFKYEGWWFKGIRYEKEEHPFNIFREEHALQETYEEWPNDMKFLFEIMYK